MKIRALRKFPSRIFVLFYIELSILLWKLNGFPNFMLVSYVLHVPILLAIIIATVFIDFVMPTYLIKNYIKTSSVIMYIFNWQKFVFIMLFSCFPGAVQTTFIILKVMFANVSNWFDFIICMYCFLQRTIDKRWTLERIVFCFH